MEETREQELARLERKQRQDDSPRYKEGSWLTLTDLHALLRLPDDVDVLEVIHVKPDDSPENPEPDPLSQALAAARARLPHRERRVLEMLTSGMAQEQVAQAEGKTQPWVSMVRKSAVRLLADKLGVTELPESSPAENAPEPLGQDLDPGAKLKDLPCSRCDFRGSFKALKRHAREAHPEILLSG
jgi:hypothetical protein